MLNIDYRYDYCLKKSVPVFHYWNIMQSCVQMLKVTAACIGTNKTNVVDLKPLMNVVVFV